MSMEDQNGAPQSANPRPHRPWIAGAVLVGLGLFSLVGQFVPIPSLGLLFLPTLGVFLLGLGAYYRHVGPMIPGGILVGIGLGAILIEGPFSAYSNDARGGVFMLTFAAGWFLITLLSAVRGDETHWWPLIPGSIMAVVGGALLAGGWALDALALGGRFWPIGLIVLGLYLMLWRRSLRA